MEISSNIVNNLNFNQPEKQTKNQTDTSFCAGMGSCELPSVYTQGVSQVNADLPMSYSKIAEIPIPGLADRASVFRLANGQKVVICPKKGPTFVKTTYNVGSLNETEDIRGISHYIEHNLFNGSKGLAPKEYDTRVSKLGGSTNASTCLSATDYYLSLQLLNDNSLEEAIKLNALQTQFPEFLVEQLEKEKEPVKSEIDVYRDIPDCIAENIVIKNLFGIQSNSMELTLGTKDNINSFTRDKVLNYFDTWYTPDNAVTVITGDVNTDETIRLVSKYFNKQNNYSKVNQRFYQPLSYLTKTVREDLIMQNSTDASILMGFAVPEGLSKQDSVKIDMLLTLLGASSSNLSKALDKYGLSAQFNSQDVQNKPGSAKTLACYVKPSESQLEEVLKILYREITAAAYNPPSFEELNNVKTKMLYSLNSLSESSDKLNSALTGMLKENDLNFFNDRAAIINSITPQDICDAARRFLDLNRTAICVSHSKDATSQSISENFANANSAPYAVSFGASISPIDSVKEESQKVVEFRLPNNIETKFIPSSSNLKSSFTMSFDTDELNDISRPAMNVLEILLNRGSAYRSFDNYTQIKESRDFNSNFGITPDGLIFYSEFYSKDANDVIALMKESLLSPNFSPDEFERAKKIAKDLIMSEPKNSFDNLLRDIFPSIRAHASKEQKLQEIENLTFADIQNLYSRIMSTAQVHATISAPVNENPQLFDLYNQALSYNLPIFRPVTKEKSPSFNHYQPVQQAKIIKDVEDNAQASITQAFTFKKSQNIDDQAKIRLLSLILGEGGMSSRLFRDLREQEKLAYHVNSNYCTIKDTGMIMLNISTTTESPDPNEGSPANVTKSLNGFERNVNLLKNSLISQEELDMAKTILKTDILNELETSFSKLFSFHSAEDSPYDNSYNEELLAAIDRVSVQDIKDAANYAFKNPPITSIVASKNTFDALNL